MDKRPIIRQGDVLFVPIDSPPKGKLREGEKVIVRGEATGHAHRVADECEAEIYFDAAGLPCGMRAKKATRVVHEEHRTALLEGDYKIVLQHEYDPDAAAKERRVAD